jgi:hypothetical protein
MNSIDEKTLAAFYREHITPAAERLRARERAFFAVAPGDEPSWYTAPPEGDEIAPLEPEDFERRLRVLWAADPELGELMRTLIALSRELEHDEDCADEVSPLIYVMF